MIDPLLARVLAEPADMGLRQVWADALVERGDPRGELIALQAAAPSVKTAARIRSLLSRHRVEWLGTLANVVQHREGLVFDRGVLDECQLQPKNLSALDAAVGHPLWATVRRIWFANHFAWDSRSVPLLTHPVFANLRDVLCIGMCNMFGPLWWQERPLPFRTIWTVDDRWRNQRGWRELTYERPGLPALERLGFTFNDQFDIVNLPIVRRIKKLGLTVTEPSGVWRQRISSLENIRTLEMRPTWIPIQGATRPHLVLTFTRGSDGEFSELELSAVRETNPRRLAIELESLPADAISRIVSHLPESEVGPLVARFRRADIVYG
jgi:uncharacterized protein (TIGR02996 family)